MKKTILLLIILVASAFTVLAASPAAGSWDCVATVDQEYPFVLTITDKDGVLTGKAESYQGDAGPVENIKIEDGVLTFSIDTAAAGMIDFEGKLDGNTIKGTLEGWDFGGEFTGTRKD